MPENSLRRSEARISATAGTGPSIRNLIFAGDGFGAMSGTSKTKSEMVSLRPGRRIGRRLPDGDGRGAAGHPGLQIGVAHQRHLVDRPQGHAGCDDVDGKTVIRDRRAPPRQISDRRVDADLDALQRAAFDPLDHPFADFGHDQDRPHPLQRRRRHRRSRETQRQARLAGIVDAAGSGDADLAIADIGLGQQHALPVGIEAQADGDAIEDQRLLVVRSGEHDGAAGKSQLPIGGAAVRAARDGPAA